MSKPFSIKTEPWSSFDRQSYSMITDDFVHSKLLTVKVNCKPSKGTVNLKHSTSRKGDSFKFDGEIKLWFPVWNSRGGALYFRAKNNEFKVHYDDGLKDTTLGQFKSYNLYASYQSEKTMKNIVLKAGANLLANNFNLDNRVKVGLADNGENDISTGHKFGYAKDNWSFNAFEVFNWRTQSLVHNALRVGFKKDDHEFFFRAESKNNRSLKNLEFGNLDTYFGSFIFNLIRKVDDTTKVGLESEFTKKGFKKGTLVVQKSISNRDTGIKMKFCSDKSAAVCYQSVLKDYGKWTAGWEVSDLGKTNKSQFGLQFEVNL